MQKERQIICSAQEVRALLDGRKTQTRSVITPQPFNGRTDDDIRALLIKRGALGVDESLAALVNGAMNAGFVDVACPYGRAGDRLWVGEEWAHDASSIEQCRAAHEDAMGGAGYGPYYRATECAPETLSWIPAGQMPQWASRIALEVKKVRVERLQDISRGDCMAEGCPFQNMAESDPKKWYADSWNSTHKADTWDKNPWVWVIEFKRVAACSTDPQAQHGFNRNASHDAGRYVCDCEGQAAA